MREVTVERGALLERLRENRKNHRDLFLKAQEGYRARVIEELDQMLSDARIGKPIRASVALVEPQDHTDEYDRVVRMLEMSVDHNITIDARSFAQFAMDQWDWTSFAETTNRVYSSGGKLSK